MRAFVCVSTPSPLPPHLSILVEILTLSLPQFSSLISVPLFPSNFFAHSFSPLFYLLFLWFYTCHVSFLFLIFYIFLFPSLFLHLVKGLAAVCFVRAQTLPLSRFLRVGRHG